MSAANGETLVSVINRLLLRLDARGVSANEIVACIKPLIAESEAKALSSLAMVTAESADRNISLRLERDQLRAERDSIKQEIEMVEHRAYRAEAKISNQAERIRYLEGATNHATGTPLSQAMARAERAEAREAEQKWLKESAVKRAKELTAELAGIRALADRRNKRYHVEDTTHQLVAALDQALDIAQADLATERARLDHFLRWDPTFNSREDIYRDMQEAAK